MTSPGLALLLFPPISLIAVLFGSRLLRSLRLVDDDTPGGGATPGGVAFALATGYAVLGYAVAALGLARHLGAVEVAGVLVLMALLGLPAWRGVMAEARRLGRRLRGALSATGGRWPLVGLAALLGCLLCLALLGTGVVGLGALVGAAACLALVTGLGLWRPGWGIAWLLMAWAAVTLLAALAPPSDMDWDGLAEHLAQAKIYAHTGAYTPLWYDHHSHFPALVTMLFAVGMKLEGAALAKLFHWAFGMIGLFAAFSLGEGFVARGAGKWAALTFASTPVVGWLMQVGYVDLGTTAFGLLATLGFLAWLRSRSARDLALAGIMAGCMMGTKAQGICLFGVLLAAVGVAGLWRRAGAGEWARAVATFGLVAGLIAAPWYLKSWLTTGNPVYPFAYNIFGGKYWGPAEAQQYDYHQKEFGVDHLPPADQYFKLAPGQRRFVGPRSPRNLLLAPWNLTFDPTPFEVLWRQGNQRLLTNLLMFWIGPLYFVGAVLLLKLAVLRRGACSTPDGARTCTALGLLFAPLWVWWLMSMQLARYLVPSLVLVTPVIGAVWHRLQGRAARAIPLLWLGVAVAMAAYLAAPGVAVVCGMLRQDDYLRATCPVYEASMAVNRIVPPGGKVILYGEPRGFYLDVDYLWGDPGHHRLIPYDRLKTPQGLVAYLRGMGVTDVLINQAFAGPFSAQSGGPIGLLHGAAQEGLARPVTDETLRRPEYVILALGP